jgi:hypothetical protein
MRAPFLILPLTLALAAPLSVMADETSRVLFCSGDCFAVDADGVRTAAPKGTSLLPGQHLETGPGSDAQMRLKHADADHANHPLLADHHLQAADKAAGTTVASTWAEVCP